MNLTTSAGGGELEKLIVGVLFVGGQASGPYANALSVYLDRVKARVARSGARVTGGPALDFSGHQILKLGTVELGEGHNHVATGMVVRVRGEIAAGLGACEGNQGEGCDKSHS